MNKDVIYVDVDDEITTIIDKVNGSPAKVVALVLPKRAGVFQSVVNMKLLKRRAEAAKKHLVLITSEAGLMPLAGLAGVHVAQTLQSKPEIPTASAMHADTDPDEEESASLQEDFDPQSSADVPVGALAGAGAAVGTLPPIGQANDEDTIELDNTAKTKKQAGLKNKPLALSSAAAANKALTGAKDKKPNIPNFKRFQKRLLIGGLVLVLLIAGWIVANNVLPKATVTIRTDSSDIDARFDMTLDATATAVNVEQRLVPAQSKQEQKSNTQTVPATGQENKGEKAEGAVRMTATMCAPNIAQPADIPAGTGITSGGNTYLTQTTATFSYNGAAGSCVRYVSTANIEIVALKGGQSYNTANDASFTVNAMITGQGQATGGTDNIVKVVQQSDIDGAKQKLTASQNEDAIKTQLQSRLKEDGLFPLTATFFAGQPNSNVSSNVGDEAENVTVTQSTTYTMFGAKESDIAKLVADNLDGKYDKSKQGIMEDGVTKATYAVPTAGAGPKLAVNTNLTATVGPKLKADEVAKQIVGMKSGEVRDTLKANPGVTDVTVSYSPFWVTSAPKAEKTTVVFEKSGNAGER